MEELLNFNSLFYIIAAIACLGTIFGAVPVGLFIVRMVRGQSAKHATPLSAGIPAEGAPVPLVASTLSIKQSANTTFGKNNINPLLVLYPDRVVYRYFFKKEKPYSQIESVAVYSNLRPWARLRFTFSDGSWSFIAWLVNQQDLEQITAFLECRGVRVDAGTW